MTFTDYNKRSSGNEKNELNQDVSDTLRKEKFKNIKKTQIELTDDKNRYYEEQIQEMEEAGRRKDSKKLF